MLLADRIYSKHKKKILILVFVSKSSRWRTKSSRTISTSWTSWSSSSGSPRTDRHRTTTARGRASTPSSRPDQKEIRLLRQSKSCQRSMNLNGYFLSLHLSSFLYISYYFLTTECIGDLNWTLIKVTRFKVTSCLFWCHCKSLLMWTAILWTSWSLPETG